MGFFDDYEKKAEEQKSSVDKTRMLGLEFLEQMEPVLELLAGFKARLAEDGYSETAQETMAVAMFVSMMTPQQQKQ